MEFTIFAQQAGAIGYAKALTAPVLSPVAAELEGALPGVEVVQAEAIVELAGKPGTFPTHSNMLRYA